MCFRNVLKYAGVNGKMTRTGFKIIQQKKIDEIRKAKS